MTRLAERIDTLKPRLLLPEQFERSVAEDFVRVVPDSAGEFLSWQGIKTTEDVVDDEALTLLFSLDNDPLRQQLFHVFQPRGFLAQPSVNVDSSCLVPVLVQLLCFLKQLPVDLVRQKSAANFSWLKLQGHDEVLSLSSVLIQFVEVEYNCICIPKLALRSQISHQSSVEYLKLVYGADVFNLQVVQVVTLEPKVIYFLLFIRLFFQVDLDGRLR